MKTNTIKIPKEWSIKKIKDLLVFERPDNYIVESSIYTDSAKTPVLTANKSFILGYTDENFGIYTKTPSIIFDDFTTDSKYVDFPFKIKSSAIKILKSKDDNADIKFVYEVMKSIHFPIANHKRHYISQYQELDIPVPPINEQQKIAEILFNVDTEIDKVEAITNHTKRLKVGLMEDLFTKGIGHKKFKKTKIGEVPVDSEITTIEAIGDFKRGPFGGALKKEIFVETGYKVYEQKNAIYNDFTLGSYFIDSEKYEEMKGFAVKTGDILVSCSGTLGKVAVVPQGSQEGIINQALMRITPSKEWDISYVKYLLESDYIQTRFTEVAPGSAMKNMASMQTIKSTQIIKPLLDEQKKIASILSAVDEQIKIGEDLRLKLQVLKRGLVTDLLKGKVRTI